MPAPIVLSTLTPETKRVPNPPAGQPVIATKAEFRDGTRVSEPAAPPAVGLSEQEWITRLEATAQNFTTGTADPSFDPRTDITFVGAFRVPFYNTGSTSTRQKQSLAYNPPNGTNGTDGSLFIGGRQGVAEISIPALSTDPSPANLNPASFLQDWFYIYGAAPASNSASDQYNGWLKVINGRLYSSWYNFYTTTYKNIYNLVISEDVTNIATGGTIGAFHMTADPSQPGQFDEDHVVRYCGDIPADKQAMFGGNTHFAGISANISIVDRSSFGPAFYSISLGGIAATDTVIPTTQWQRYPSSNPVAGWSGQNGLIVDHYTSVIGQDLKTYCDSPVAGRETSFDAFALPDESIRRHMGTYENSVGCAFIPPGTNSLVVIGATFGMRYGVGYKGRTMELGPDGPGSGGYHPFGLYDRDNVFWTVNLSDISNSVTNDDVAYSDFGIFDNNRFRDDLESQGIGNSNKFYRPAGIVGGTFDPGSGKLYVLQSAAYPFGGFEFQHVVSVYQVGAPF